METEKEKIFYNALNIVLDSNYAKLSSLREKFPSWEKAFFSLPEEKKKEIEPEKEWEEAKKEKIEMIFKEDALYPNFLLEIPFTPLAIYYKGKLPENCEEFGDKKNNKNTAIVGTRKATYEGKKAAKEFARELAKRGVSIISGLALGIDEAAHSGALEAGGKTFAVLANGLSSVYPRQNYNLAEVIIKKGGALISEYPPKAPPLSYRFLERNRIISGLSSAILMIEAPERSGALATARFALEQNRDIYVVPGPITHINFKGSHKLLREGARIVSSLEELLEDLGLAEETFSVENKVIAQIKNETQKKILEIIKEKTAAVSIDEIINAVKLTAQEVNQELAFLEAEGIIAEEGGKYRIS